MVQRLILALILATALVGPAARAQRPENRERTARTSCLSGDYAKGVAILSELFVDTRDPTHIYNQGRCFEQNRRYEDAIGRFQEYLRVGRKLSTEEISEAKKHIADCQQLLADQGNTAQRPSGAEVTVKPSGPETDRDATVAPPPDVTARPTESPARPGRGLRTAGIIVGAGGVAGVVAGALLSLKANSLASDMEKLDGYTPDRESSQSSYRNLGMVAYGVGAACIVTGGVLYLLGLRKAPTKTPGTAFAPIIAPGVAGAALRGAF
jgi:hypothetical protein